ncbi:MAG: transcription elongation factor GreA [Erysipelotrichales bacterium]|nr:transcription elongation factor GreA [Erysipelotrichales bacterium]
MSEKKEIKLTAAGYADIETELAKLREEDRPRIIQAIKEARAQGDLSENADYDAARDEQAKTESRIKELEYMLEHATIIKSAKKGTVGLGSKVTISYVDDDDEDEYMIVGSLEANILENKISDESAMGAALCGHKVGDIVTIESPNGSYDVKIVKVD